MHVTACLTGQEEVDVEVGEDCRSLPALREAIVEALPQLCVEGFDVSVGGRALDDDEGVVSLEENVCLDVVPNTRVLSIVALREAGREVSERGLRRAAASGDVPQCTLYLDAGVPLDCVDAGGDTPLHIASNAGHSEVATLLLDRGTTAIDEKNSVGDTPLHLACYSERLEIARLLLDRGTTAIDEKNNDGDTPLHLACSCISGCIKDLELVGLLLDRDSTTIDEKNDDGDTPLHLACEHGHVDIARLLLDRGSTAIDEKNDDGVTPLLCSCNNGHPESYQLGLVRLLLDRGSTAIDEKSDEGFTPLHHARCGAHVKVARLLLDRGCSDVEACKADDPSDTQQGLELVSERGPDVLHDAGHRLPRLCGLALGFVLSSMVAAGTFGQTGVDWGVFAVEAVSPPSLYSRAASFLLSYK